MSSEILAKDQSIPLCSHINHPYLDEVLQTSPIGVLILDEERRITWLNQEVERMLGPSGVVRGCEISALCERGEDVQPFKEYLAARNGRCMTLALKQSGDGRIHVKIHAFPRGAETLLYLENITDVSALSEELFNFKSAINSAEDAIALFDNDGLIFYTNPAFEKQMRWSADCILGMNIDRFWKESLPREACEIMWRQIREKSFWSGEVVCRRANGESFDADIRITPIKEESQAVAGFICIQRDISRQKKLEKELSMYSEILERKVDDRATALSKLHEISKLFHTEETLEKRLRLVLIAATAGETFRFNRAFLLLVNEETQWLEGKIAIGPSNPQEASSIWSEIETLPKDGTITGALQTYLAHPGRGDRYVNELVRQLSVPMPHNSSILLQSLRNKRSYIVRKSKSDVEFDADIIHKLGSDNFAVVPLLVRERPIGVLVVDNVITQRIIVGEDLKMLDVLGSQAALAIAHAHAIEALAQKVKETELAYSELRLSQQKLIESEKFAALGQMAATVAHEIRTPLVAVGGFAQQMLKTEDKSKKNYHYLQIIRDEALRLEDVLNHLLYYARPSTPLKDEQDINRFLESILTFMKAESDFNNIKVELRFDHNLPPIRFDRNQMRQVMINIFKNAFQSMEKGGTLTIATRSDEEWIYLEIRDTGEGIAPEHLNRIFEPFYSTKHSGTGLGLHVSQRIVASHGGNLSITSRLREGTTALIRLPRKGDHSQ
ncbi:MAG: ATP-binding protein [Candidatus Omnitrophota bacterium]